MTVWEIQQTFQQWKEIENLFKIWRNYRHKR